MKKKDEEDGKNKQNNNNNNNAVNDAAPPIDVLPPAPRLAHVDTQGRSIKVHPRAYKIGKDRIARVCKVTLPPGKTWISTSTEYSDFAPALWVVANDNRPHQPYERLSKDYVDSSRRARLAEIANYVAKNGRVAKKTEFSVNGMHTRQSKFALLQAPKFQDAPFDPMHAIANCLKYIFDILMCERGTDERSRKLCLFQKRFPFLADDRIRCPWQTTKNCRIRADSVFECLNVPSKYKRDYSFDLPFQHIGHMNSHQKLVFVLAYFEYFISFTAVSVEYKNLFSRWANDVRAMFNPCLKPSSLTYLANHVHETRALFEFMLPDSEAVFVFHQIVDIVHSLKRLGPARSWSCFSGERTMKKLADTVPDGGRKYLYTIAERFVAKENAQDYNAAGGKENENSFTDNAGFYSGMPLKFLKKSTPLPIDDCVKEMLFQSLQEFLVTQEISHLIVKSAFGRLYFTFEGLYSSSADCPRTMTEWLHQLYEARLEGGFTALKVTHLVHGVINDDAKDCYTRLKLSGRESEEELEELSAMVLNDCVEAGCGFESDFDGIIADLAKFGACKARPLLIFKHATVKGIELTARGSEFAEDKLVLQDLSGSNRVGLTRMFVVQKAANKLVTNWYPLFQLNAWCKVLDYYIARRGAQKQVASRTYFGQLNYFFRLFVPSDHVIHGLAFANLVLRKPTDNKDTKHSSISADDMQSYYADKQFIPLHYVCSTAVAVNAFDVDDMPIMNPSKSMRQVRNAVVDYDLEVSRRSASDVVRFDMVELHKERLHLTYDSVEIDADQVKCFEPEHSEHFGH